VAYSGKQSLRLENISDRTSNKQQVSKAAEEARGILEALEASRGRYEQEAPADTVEWVIHNARIVEQCMRSRANNAFIVRDRSMAENVAWILEQNPGEKIVLWAHNGHIARQGMWMGAHLWEMFGDAYLPVGFATRTGKYFAIGDGTLGENNLQDPPAGSIENYLAATGEPRLILDLRLAEEATRGAGWLTEPRPFRSIGAKAMDQQFFPKNIVENFDVLIYFDSTSAAVQLGQRPSR
jgi:erythromycin esterase